jgi:cobalamin biosynthesis Mg chelatase CobN
VTGEQGAGAPLPAEVPREFADAYREAYEAALAAQAENKPGTHAERRPSSGIRLRRERRSATAGSSENDGAVAAASAAPGSSGIEEPREPAPYERVRDSVWFVPAMLGVLVLMMLVGAYVLGRVFATHVGT